MNCAFDIDCLFPQKPERKRNGCFAKGHTPANKGRKWEEWMSEGGRINAKKNLEKGRHCGNWKIAQESRKIAIVGVAPNGKAVYFDCAADAERKTGIYATNIRHCCNGKRNEAGGVFWFYADKWNGVITERMLHKHESADKYRETKRRNKGIK